MLDFYNKYVGTDDYYGAKAYTYTMHAHSHLQQQVLEQGNLEGHILNSFEVVC